MHNFITVTVAATKGSAPRDRGASMQVWRTHQTGTIGGGALEYQAAQVARQMLVNGDRQTRRSVPLGPDLGQCCGGSVTLDFNLNADGPDPTQPPLWIWGAGHVGRAIASVMVPFGDRTITLIDTAADRLPDPFPNGVAPLVAADPVRAVTHAPTDADHLIVTYSHAIDLALCDALLRHGFASAGLIGSDTKWVRFRKRLASMGHSDAQITRIACPIGNRALGKHPQAIAVGVAAALICPATKGIPRQ